MTGLFLQAHLFQANPPHAALPRAAGTEPVPRLSTFPSDTTQDAAQSPHPQNAAPQNTLPSFTVLYTQCVASGIKVLPEHFLPSKQNCLRHLLNFGMFQRYKKAERKVH